ncbi:hypothetical protein [Empedobacter sp.]|uniref:hypothetical protein n=1 Tax=Empedobacter sp. TaxID=1927715 RepID=UPI0028A8BB90|nr:hypothetical protein [Empedobacter sp.]
MKEKENTLHNVNEITEISKRFLHVLKIKDYSGYRLEKENSGIKSSQISHIKSGRNQPSSELIDRLLSFFPDINRVWLLTGEGSMLNNSNEYSEAEVVTKNKVEIPYYNVDFSGGWKSENLFTTHQPSFFITNPEFTRAEFACNLVGNSISRRIPHNAIIGLKEIKEWKVYFPTNEIYAVVMKNELRTVKIVKRSANKDFLTLIPDPLDIYNQTGYEPEEVPIDFIEKFFQVVAWGQFEKLAM